MNSKEPVLSTLQRGHLTLTLNRPEALNALAPDMVEQMIAALTDADAIRSCTIMAEGRSFCAGFDLSGLDTLSDGDLLWRFLRIEKLLQLVQHAPFPVQVLAQGHVVGAGADLFAACWMRIAASDAKFKMPGWNFGLALGTRRLARLIGRDGARGMLIEARSVSAKEALALGLASRVVDADRWAEERASFETRACALPASSLRALLGLTELDTRAEDLAAIVHTAGEPGLKERIRAFRARVAKERAARSAA